MHDVARAAAEDSMKLVLARSRKTDLAAVFQTRKAVAKIPAPGALANVARESAGVANLRRAHFLGGFRQHGVLFADALIAAQGIESDQAADLELPALNLNLIQPSDGLQIHQHVRRNQMLLHHPKQIASAAHDGCATALTVRLA